MTNTSAHRIARLLRELAEENQAFADVRKAHNDRVELLHRSIDTLREEILTGQSSLIDLVQEAEDEERKEHV